jgi:hypothetical protein
MLGLLNVRSKQKQFEVTPKSSSINWFKTNAIPTSSSHLKLIVMAKFKASLNKQ